MSLESEFDWQGLPQEEAAARVRAQLAQAQRQRDMALLAASSGAPQFTALAPQLGRSADEDVKDTQTGAGNTIRANLEKQLRDEQARRDDLVEQHNLARDAETARHNRADEANTRARLAAAGQKDKDIPPAVSTQVGASANTARMIDKLSAQYDAAMKSNLPIEWKKYNDMVDSLAPSIAAGVNRTGVARGDLVREIRSNLQTTGSVGGVVTGGMDKLFGTGFVKNKLDSYREEARSRGRESIDSIGDKYDKAALERQHASAFPDENGPVSPASGGAPKRAGWEHMPDGSKYPVDAQGNRIGPAVR